MNPRQRTVLCDAIQTSLIVAFLGSAIFGLPSMVEGGLQVFGRQIKRMEVVSDEFSLRASALVNQVIR
jgi:hypothetical protein